MVGLKVNAKGKPVGFRMGTWKEGTGFLQARWLKCSKLFSCDLASEERIFVCVRLTINILGGEAAAFFHVEECVSYLSM